jgi:hypothetical protein
MVVGDRAMLSAEIVQAYHQANLKYLGALKVMGEKEEELIVTTASSESTSSRSRRSRRGRKRKRCGQRPTGPWSS